MAFRETRADTPGNSPGEPAFCAEGSRLNLLPANVLQLIKVWQRGAGTYLPAGEPSHSRRHLHASLKRPLLQHPVAVAAKERIPRTGRIDNVHRHRRLSNECLALQCDAPFGPHLHHNDIWPEAVKLHQTVLDFSSRCNFGSVPFRGDDHVAECNQLPHPLAQPGSVKYHLYP